MPQYYYQCTYHKLIFLQESYVAAVKPEDEYFYGQPPTNCPICPQGPPGFNGSIVRRKFVRYALLK